MTDDQIASYVRKAIGVLDAAADGTEPVLGCWHVFEDAAGKTDLWMCLKHPAAGVSCGKCAAAHRRRHAECVTCGRPLEADDVGVGCPFPRASLLVRHPRAEKVLQMQLAPVVILSGLGWCAEHAATNAAPA